MFETSSSPIKKNFKQMVFKGKIQKHDISLIPEL